ncbi:MAG: aquaporin [Actinobacteria bacterium]|nr:aquaporin [Actinomycetota bacterium]
MEYTRWQKALAEFIGPLAVVFVGGGAAIISNFNLAGSGLVTVALAYGLVIATMVTATGHVSGGHLNPAVTIGAWVTQKISSSLAIMYIIAQLLGGIAGALLLRAALPKQLWDPSHLGATSVVRGISNGQAVLIEAILTFFLVWVVFGVAIDPEGAWNKVSGLAIGFVIAMDAMFGGPLTGAAMNPARAFGPALVSGHWTGIWVYFVGPIAGAIVAAALYDGIILRPRLTPVVETVDELTEGAVSEELPPEEQFPHGIGAHGEE